MQTRGKRVPRSELFRARVGISITPGEMLRTVRELQELTQSELAELTGIAQSNLSALETGARELGRERALVLAKALKVHPAVILFPDFDVSEVA
ncbi:MAG: helix-turn-helix transcriptional regulator [Deltaproteobacteria bacterium]|nr:helix-turn-helix transcriptional regulator [Deltaproteobacteria bacterium]